MSEQTENIKTLIQSLAPSELQSLAAYFRAKLPKHALEVKWGITYDVILDAINRAQDITQRGVRGVIAEAVFESEVLPTIKGWRSVPVIGDLPYDFKIQKDSSKQAVTIQVKLQRTVKGIPLARKVFGAESYVVEVQKTRTGKKKLTSKSGSTEPLPAKVEAEVVSTRPYRFGDFDILAVNMQPLTRDWSRFMYTVGSWLMPRTGSNQSHLIEIMQPVNSTHSDVWTDSIEECIEWFLSGEKKRVFDLEAVKKRVLGRNTKNPGKARVKTSDQSQRLFED